MDKLIPFDAQVGENGSKDAGGERSGAMDRDGGKSALAGPYSLDFHVRAALANGHKAGFEKEFNELRTG